MSKYTPGAAGAEVHSRAERYVSEHEGVTFREAMNVVLKSDKDLAQAYAAPASRRARMPQDPRSQVAVPVSPDDEAEITDWVMRAVRDGKAGSLPGALGDLAVETDKLAKIGMPVEEATRRAMGAFPNLLALAKILLADIRRTSPEKPVAQQAQANPAQSPGDIVHMRAKALTEKHPHMDYSEAMGAVLSEDLALKNSYART